MKDIQHYSLLRHNTFGIDASCRRFIMFDNLKELGETLDKLSAADDPVMPLGEGSNLLLTKDYEGTVLCSNIGFIDIRITADKHATVRCGSGVHWDDLVAECVELGAYGLENLSLIPGTVGAAAVQNIGAYGVEMKDFVYSITAYEIATKQKKTFLNADIDYAYRYSKFKTDWKNRFIIAEVELRFDCYYHPHLDYGNIRAELERQNITDPTPQQLRQTIISIRQAKLPDPAKIGNAGSFFMNPIVDKAKYESLAAQYAGMPHYDIDDQHIKIPAGWMIDQCGWKGRALGKAAVHDKQALVLVNLGGATGNDVLQLCHTIQQDVYHQFGIHILPEVNIL
ncbi:MAG: UDP-N-acetylmuramate dehydrogenase [Prevotella sp.]